MGSLKSVVICQHKDKRDLSQGLGDIRHFYCPACGWHEYKDREWTKNEWEEEYVK